MSRRQKAMEQDPFREEEEILRRTFFRSPSNEGEAAPAKPDHYKICSFSLYIEDIERLEKLVKTLKKRGHTKANKSQVIRYALATVDLSKMPKSF